MACSKVIFTFNLHHFDVQEDTVSSKRLCNENSGTLANFYGTDEADMLDAVCVHGFYSRLQKVPNYSVND
jgi:hypothetical protein